MPTKEGLAKLYDMAAWQRRRALQLKQFPLCAECLRPGAVRPATCVDHVERWRAGRAPMTSINSCSSRSGRFARIVTTGRPPPSTWAITRGADARHHRFPAPRDFHQVHPVSGDGRLHRRYRRHHLRQSDQGIARAVARSRAGRVAEEVTSALGCKGQSHADRGRAVGCHRRDHSRTAQAAAALAGNADCGWRDRCGDGLLGLPVETIGTKFGGIPSTLPFPRLPDPSWEQIVAVFPAAISFTLLGAIESLLSAVVADGMSGRRHRSNCELVAQGVANVGASLFGGFCVTGTIARTATNVRAGAHGPVAGMLHAVFLLLFMLIAAPLAPIFRWQPLRACWRWWPGT